MIIKKNLILQKKDEKPILYDVYIPTENGSSPPLVIFCHGYKGFKDWGAWHLVAEIFADAGFCFLKFNFSHNGGTVDQPIDFPDLEAFAQNNFSLELDDLEGILNSIERGNEHLPRDISNISLIGHSRGGGIVLIKASEDERIKNVITWAGVSDFKSRFHEGTEAFYEWAQNGVMTVANTRTKQLLPHYFQFYEDYKSNESRFTIKRAVENLKIPFLIVQGDEDPTVSLEEAKALHSWDPDAVLEIVPGGDHVFGAKHPWEELFIPVQLKKIVKTSIDFLK